MNLVYGCFSSFELQFMRKKTCIFCSLGIYSCHHPLLVKGDGVIYDESARNFCGYANFLKLKAGPVYITWWGGGWWVRKLE